MTEWLTSSDFSSVPTDLPTVIIGLLLAFTCGHLLAWVYMITHSGLSYSRSFVNSLVILPTIVSMVMQVLQHNLVTAFGMMAVFAIVRFRNILRDTLDTSYVLAVIVIGMACGTMKFGTGIVGCLLTCLVMLYLWITAFGTRHRYDLIVNLHWSRELRALAELTGLLDRHCLNAVCASQRTSERYEGTDLSYRAQLRDPSRMDELLTELKTLPGVTRVTGLKSEDESEI